MKKKLLVVSLIGIVSIIAIFVGFKQQTKTITSEAYEIRFHYAEQLYSYAMFYSELSQLLSENNLEKISLFIKGNKIGLEKRAIYEDVSEIVFNDLQHYYNDELNIKIASIFPRLRSAIFEIYTYFDDSQETKKIDHITIINELNELYPMLYPFTKDRLGSLNLYNILVHPDEIMKNNSKEQIYQFLNKIDLALTDISK